MAGVGTQRLDWPYGLLFRVRSRLRTCGFLFRILQSPGTSPTHRCGLRSGSSLCQAPPEPGQLGPLQDAEADGGVGRVGHLRLLV